MLIILSDEVCVDLYQVQAYVQQLPIVEDDPDKRLEPEECQEIKSAVDIAQNFSILGKYMNCNNFNLLGRIIGIFGIQRTKNLLQSYIEKTSNPGDCQLYKVSDIFMIIRFLSFYFLSVFVFLIVKFCLSTTALRRRWKKDF